MSPARCYAHKRLHGHARAGTSPQHNRSQHYRRGRGSERLDLRNLKVLALADSDFITGQAVVIDVGCVNY
jgi:hypothetical protein